MKYVFTKLHTYSSKGRPEYLVINTETGKETVEKISFTELQDKYPGIQYKIASDSKLNIQRR